MTRDGSNSSTVYCDDSQLVYNKYKTEFADGQALTFDQAYRLAHLPLVAPDHPKVIPSKQGTSYDRGMHDLSYSIAIPIPFELLQTSTTFNKMHDELKAATFTDKLSWNTYAHRKDKLHATICGGLSTGEAPDIDKTTFEKLRAIGPVSVCIRGLFSGNINIGRLYLQVYPELRDGKNMCHVLQQTLASPVTDLYVVGLFNFMEELNVVETQELKYLLEKRQNTDFFTMSIEHLWLLGSRDDLVLNGSVDKIITIV